jgi:5'-AMP-activated protein kinase, regulatory gamma subunit
MDTSVIDVIFQMVKRSISSVPIVTSQSKVSCSPSQWDHCWLDSDILLNVFEAVDVITLIKGGDYESLQLTVGEALRKRPAVRHPPSLQQESGWHGVQDYAGIYTCSMDDGLDTIFETIRKSRVHRLMIIDESQHLEGLLSLSDILQYILLEGEGDEAADSWHLPHASASSPRDSFLLLRYLDWYDKCIAPALGVGD